MCASRRAAPSSNPGETSGASGGGAPDLRFSAPAAPPDGVEAREDVRLGSPQRGEPGAGEAALQGADVHLAQGQVAARLRALTSNRGCVRAAAAARRPSDSRTCAQSSSSSATVGGVIRAAGGRHRIPTVIHPGAVRAVSPRNYAPATLRRPWRRAGRCSGIDTRGRAVLTEPPPSAIEVRAWHPERSTARPLGAPGAADARGRPARIRARGGALRPPVGRATGNGVEGGGVALDRTGSTVYIADPNVGGSGRITAYDRNGTVLRVFERATGVDVERPLGLAVDSSGNLSVFEGDRNRVLVLSPTGAVVRAVAPTGTAAFDDLAAGIAIDAGDNLYVADTRNSRVEVFDAAGALVRTIALGGGFVTDVAVDAGRQRLRDHDLRHRRLRGGGAEARARRDAPGAVAGHPVPGLHLRALRHRDRPAHQRGAGVEPGRLRPRRPPLLLHRRRRSARRCSATAPPATR